MPLFGTRDEGEDRFKKAKHYSDPSKKEFDLDTAIRLLEEAVMLKPDKKQYGQKLDEIREIKAKSRLKFSMRVDEAFPATFITGAQGMVVRGRVKQGTIRIGDEVEIRGLGRTRRAKVFEVDSLKGFGIPSERVPLLIEDLTKDDVKPGDKVEGV